VYPKDFKFVGWHPACRCFATSVLKTPDELEADNERIMNGDEPLTESVNTVKDMPENFKGWIDKNADRIAAAEKRGTLPYFIKDNKGYVTNAKKGAGYFTTYISTTANVTPTTPLDLSNINVALSDIAKQYPEYFNKGYNGIFPAPAGQQYFMSADINTGKIFVNFAANENGFDAGTSLVKAFEKIRAGAKLTEHEEYSIEVLWHEILHLKSKNTTVLPSINTVDTGFQRVAMETFNQIVARKTYPAFLNQLGGKAAAHQEWILNSGYGYSDTVANTRKILDMLNINNGKFYTAAEKLLMKDYADFDKNIVSIMEKMSGRKNIMDIFGYIEIEDFDEYLTIFNKRR
jgi:hypothetical protein